MIVKKDITRRDFLKLAGVFPFSVAAPRFLNSLQLSMGKQNVIVVVFDAFSAYNVPIYGYQRQTLPKITQLAKRAIRYHNHFSGSNYTTPGTATLLTGTLPWTHRAFNPNGTVSDAFVKQNIFSAFDSYYRIAYSHNGWVNTLLKQFSNDIEEYIPRQKLLLSSDDSFLSYLFNRDDDIASVSWIRNAKFSQEGYSYSLFLSHILEGLQQRRIKNLLNQFPRGLPAAGAGVKFLLEDAINWVTDRLPIISQPFMGYFHFFPPHYPYRTSSEFYRKFYRDDYKPIEKPIDLFAVHNLEKIPEDLLGPRTEYDEYLLYCDREFSRLYQHMEETGLLENTWIVLTSDHGEMFERGVRGHSTKSLYQPVIRIPLIIFEPGRETGVDIYTKTSAIDVLPTLLHVTGHNRTPWLEGEILPPYSQTIQNPDRNIYAMRSYSNEKYGPLTQASVSLVKDSYKLMYYFGYSELNGEELIKLFNIDSDPEELNDLYLSKKETANELLDELKAKLVQENEPYL